MVMVILGVLQSPPNLAVIAMCSLQVLMGHVFGRDRPGPTGTVAIIPHDMMIGLPMMIMSPGRILLDLKMLAWSVCDVSTGTA